MVGGHEHEQRRHRRRGRKVERQDRFTYHIHRVGLRVNAQGMNKLEPLFPRHCTVPETMNLPNCYRWRARGVADRGQLLCSFHFSASAVRAIGIWHPFPREGEREMRCGNGLRKMSEQKTAVSKTFLSLLCRRRSSSSDKLHRRRVGYFSFFRSKRNASLLSLPLSLPSSVRLPIQFPISVSPPSFSAHAINRPTEKLCFREENGVKIGRRRRARPRGKLRGMGWGDRKWEGGDKQ